MTETVNEAFQILGVFIAGMVLGALFFGGLWYAVKKGLASGMPALWLLGSFLFRVSITLIGFYYIGMGSWQRIVACLLGFVTARFLVLQLTKTHDEKEKQLKKEADHEA